MRICYILPMQCRKRSACDSHRIAGAATRLIHNRSLTDVARMYDGRRWFCDVALYSRNK